MKLHEFRVPLLAMPVATCVTTGADAHAFKAGAGFYDQFLEGASVILFYPGVLLPLLAVGILAGLWHPDSVARVLVALVAGQVPGIGLSVLVGPAIAIWLIVLGVLTAVLAALLPKQNPLLCQALAFLTGLLAMTVSFEGHGFLELPAFIHAGIFLAASVSFVMAANLTRATIGRFPVTVTSIVFRVLASWIAASLLLFLAFEWRG